MTIPGERLLARVMERARRLLAERGLAVDAPFPARLVRDLLPSDGRKRMCLEAIYRAIGRGQLEAVRIGREWFCDLESFARWIERRSGSAGTAVAATPQPDAEAMHLVVGERLRRRERRRAS
jgi:hypothetical protein